MPLRDRFRSPVDGLVSWQSFHAQWTGMIVQALSHSLPHRYVAVPCAHRTTESDDAAPAVWMPPKATRIISTDLPAPAEWGVRVCDIRRGRSLVAAVQFVNPANKDRREHRQAFVAKWVALLPEPHCGRGR
jgi:hypothetical protein